MIFCKNSNAVLSRQKIPCPRSLLALCLNTIYSWSQGSKLHMGLVVLVKKCQLWQSLAKSAHKFCWSCLTKRTDEFRELCLSTVI